jgi:hypothetical protein
MQTHYLAIYHNGVNVMAQTLGEYRVGIDFNPSASLEVTAIKRQAASLIDFINDIADHADGEIRRLKAMAMTDIETAAMHAVKAVTKKQREG